MSILHPLERNRLKYLISVSEPSQIKYTTELRFLPDCFLSFSLVRLTDNSLPQ